MKKNGFTLIELLISLAIMSILMVLVVPFLTTSFNHVNIVNRDINLQSGVNTSVDMTTKKLAKSTQVHLVGKEVFEPTLDLSSQKDKLDNRFSYIAIREKNGSRYLADITPKYNSSGAFESWDETPLISLEKNDLLQNRIIQYTMNLYKDDNNYKQKFNNKVLSITITGQTYKAIDKNTISNYKEEDILKNDKGQYVQDSNIYYVKDAAPINYTKDIQLSNANQIMLSKYLNGTVKDVTAIAYDSTSIQNNTQTKKIKKKSTDKIAFLLVVDRSANMTNTINGRTRSAILGDKLKSNLLDKLHKIAKETDTDVTMYAYTYSSRNMLEPISQYLDSNGDLVNNRVDTQAELTENKKGAIRYFVLHKKTSFLYPLVKYADRNNKKYRNTEVRLENGYIRQFNDAAAYYLPYYMGPYNLKYDTRDIRGTVANDYRQGIENQPIPGEERGYKELKDFMQNTDFGMGLVNTAKESYREADLDIGYKSNKENTGNNLGEAILCATEMLEQLKALGYTKRYLIVVNGSTPNRFTNIGDNRLAHRDDFHNITMENSGSYASKWRNTFRRGGHFSGWLIKRAKENENPTIALNYVDEVSSKAARYNTDLYEKAYVLGFSDNASDKAQLDSIVRSIDKFGDVSQKLDASSENSLATELDKIGLELENSIMPSHLYDGPEPLN